MINDMKKKKKRVGRAGRVGFSPKSSNERKSSGRESWRKPCPTYPFLFFLCFRFSGKFKGELMPLVPRSFQSVCSSEMVGITLLVDMIYYKWIVSIFMIYI
jgi:hypothetical protein